MLLSNLLVILCKVTVQWKVYIGACGDCWLHLHRFMCSVAYVLIHGDQLPFLWLCGCVNSCRYLFDTYCLFCSIVLIQATVLLQNLGFNKIKKKQHGHFIQNHRICGRRKYGLCNCYGNDKRYGTSSITFDFYSIKIVVFCETFTSHRCCSKVFVITNMTEMWCERNFHYVYFVCTSCELSSVVCLWAPISICFALGCFLLLSQQMLHL